MARAYSHHWTIATRISHIPIQSDSPIFIFDPLAHILYSVAVYQPEEKIVQANIYLKKARSRQKEQSINSQINASKSLLE